MLPALLTVQNLGRISQKVGEYKSEQQDKSLAGTILFLLTFCDVAQPFSVGGWKYRVGYTFCCKVAYKLSRAHQENLKHYLFFNNIKKLYMNTYSIV